MRRARRPRKAATPAKPSSCSSCGEPLPPVFEVLGFRLHEGDAERLLQLLNAHPDLLEFPTLH